MASTLYNLQNAEFPSREAATAFFSQYHATHLAEHNSVRCFYTMDVRNFKTEPLLALLAEYMESNPNRFKLQIQTSYLLFKDFGHKMCKLF